MCQAPASGGISHALGPGCRELVMFPDEGDQAERQFWIGLEFRVSSEMETQQIKARVRELTRRSRGRSLAHYKRLRLWCDGFIPEHYLLDQVPGRITGVVWIGFIGVTHQEQWKFTLILPFSVSGRADIRWSDLLPGSEASGWLVVAPEKKEIEVRLGQ